MVLSQSGENNLELNFDGTTSLAPTTSNIMPGKGILMYQCVFGGSRVKINGKVAPTVKSGFDSADYNTGWVFVKKGDIVIGDSYVWGMVYIPFKKQ